ncbi:GL21820 [Drosophila persimilis]|uniref:GL21820 n=1 Tax=Drosophila persimilis TaxID=7234 RepID=B4GEG4_DROPE|nr:enhancer of split m6 protein [Drosophila persimilis]EDW33999.1 GL21820 [Drosophila persimilis]
MSKVKNLLAKILQRFGRGHNNCHGGSNDSQRYDSLEEIAQNQANERMLMETLIRCEEEHLVICLETAAGSFYWHSQ